MMDMIVDIFGPFGPLMLVGGLGIGLIVATLPFLLKQKEDPLEKLKRTNAAGAQVGKGKGERLRQDSGNDKLEKYSNFLEPQNEEEYSSIKLKLLQAGYRSRNSVRMFHFAQFALGIAALLAGVAYAVMQSQNGEPTTQDTLLAILIPGACGYMFPKYWVTRRQAERQAAIENGFPDSLDLMLVCVEAGQSMEQAIMRVAHELKAGFAELAEEFEMVSYELKAGKDKGQVFRDMSERCGVQDIDSFVTVLIQSQQFGTPVSEALRVYGAEMRDKRVMRAEEKANKLPTKMTLATMMLTVPPLLIILVGPSVYGVMAFFEAAAN